MKQIFIGLVIVSILFGCSTGPDPEEPLLTEFEEQEMVSTSINYKNDLYHYPDIISKSAPELDLIKNKWTSSAILCSENEDFLILRKVNNNRFIAISSEEFGDSYSFQFYDFNLEGKILHKSIIKNADYSISNRFNFTIDKDSIYYYIQKDKEATFSYSLENSIHKESQKDNSQA